MMQDRILKLSGIVEEVSKKRRRRVNEEIGFTEDDVIRSRAKMDGIASKLKELKDEMEETLKEIAKYETESGGNVIKGVVAFQKAFDKLDQSSAELRKGAFKGLGKMPIETTDEEGEEEIEYKPIKESRKLKRR